MKFPINHENPTYISTDQKEGEKEEYEWIWIEGMKN